MEAFNYDGHRDIEAVGADEKGCLVTASKAGTGQEKKDP